MRFDRRGKLSGEVPINGRLVYSLVLILLGFLYYGQYYNCGFNLGDEGSAALISQRLAEGETPYVDISLGYGVLWFYPIMLLFMLFGINFIVMKIYFFALAVCTSLLGYATVARVTSTPWLGLIAGVILILVPGVIHKSYIPLIVVGNMYGLSRIDVERRSLSLPQIAMASAIVAISALIRFDLGCVAAITLVGLVIFHSVVGRGSIANAALVLGTMVAVTAVVWLPFLLVSYWQNFLSDLAANFVLPFKVLAWSALEPFTSALSKNQLFNQSPDVGTLLQRMPLSALLETGYKRQMAFFTYMPVLVLFVISCYAISSVIHLRCQWRLIFTNDRIRPILVMVLASAALPSFLFFRPDLSHLSQFMPGYVVLACVMMHRAWTLSNASSATRQVTGESIQSKKMVFPFIVTVLLALHLVLYVVFGLNRVGTGSIAVAKGATQVFKASNGVRVLVNEKSLAMLSELKARTLKYCGEDDHLLVFPYGPGINFMTDRKTFMRKLYCDDTFLIRWPDWQDKTIEKMIQKRPAVVIISDWAVNGTEISRFSNWAQELKNVILNGYVLKGNEIGGWQLYVRKDLLFPSSRGYSTGF